MLPPDRDRRTRVAHASTRSFGMVMGQIVEDTEIVAAYRRWLGIM